MIVIKVGAQCWDCELCISGKCSKNVSEFRESVMVPGPNCPGEGTFELLPQGTAAELERLKAERVGKRLIDEEDIPTIWLATGTMQNERERNFVECTLGVAGLGRKAGTE